MKEQIAIIGAGGLTGRELLLLLKNHPNFEVVHITSNLVQDNNLASVFPNLDFSPDLVFKKHESPIPSGVTIVLATPNEVSLELAKKYSSMHRILDLSGVFRLSDRARFEKAYGIEHTAFDLVSSFVFGMPELFREKIKKARLVSNPGCYSTASIIPIASLGSIRDHIQGPVLIDAKSGVSGAGGRTEEIAFSFTKTHENFRAYKVWKHQHEPEIQEYCSVGLGKELEVYFTPHLLPVYRGILSSIYINFSKDISEEEIQTALESKAKSERFLRFRANPEEIELVSVQNSNYLDFSFQLRGRSLILISALDNLTKGAAGQALQNLNLMHGFPEDLGF